MGKSPEKQGWGEDRGERKRAGMRGQRRERKTQLPASLPPPRPPSLCPGALQPGLGAEKPVPPTCPSS